MIPYLTTRMYNVHATVICDSEI